jgi:hypothetical protein
MRLHSSKQGVKFTATVLANLLLLPARADTCTNPPPNNLLRPQSRGAILEWQTDDAGVAARTISPGHIELDVTPIQYGYFHRTDTTADRIRYGLTDQLWVYGATTIKVGLPGRIDAEVNADPYVTSTPTAKDQYGENRNTASGFGDTSARLKWNFWNNGARTMALAAYADVTFPTASGSLESGAYEGGPGLAYSWRLPSRFELRAGAGFGVYEDWRNRAQADVRSSIGLTRFFWRRAGVFAEFETFEHTQAGEDWDASVVTGAFYRITRNFEVSASVSFGVNGAAYDYLASSGFRAWF